MNDMVIICKNLSPLKARIHSAKLYAKLNAIHKPLSFEYDLLINECIYR